MERFKYYCYLLLVNIQYQQVWYKQRLVEFNSLHFSKIVFLFCFFRFISLYMYDTWTVFFTHNETPSLFSLFFNKCLIRWVHESQSTLACALCVLNIKRLCKWGLASNSPSGLVSMDAIYLHGKQCLKETLRKDCFYITSDYQIHARKQTLAC